MVPAVLRRYAAVVATVLAVATKEAQPSRADAPPIKALFPGDGALVQSPVRFDVALNAERLAP